MNVKPFSPLFAKSSHSLTRCKTTLKKTSMFSTPSEAHSKSAYLLMAVIAGSAAYLIKRFKQNVNTDEENSFEFKPNGALWSKPVKETVADDSNTEWETSEPESEGDPSPGNFTKAINLHDLLYQDKEDADLSEFEDVLSIASSASPELMHISGDKSTRKIGKRKLKIKRSNQRKAKVSGHDMRMLYEAFALLEEEENYLEQNSPNNSQIEVLSDGDIS